jgi:hypothetical protein
MTVVTRLGCCALVALAASSACGVDQRPLTYEYHPLDIAGASGSAGRSASSGDANGGDSGAADGGKSAEIGEGGACTACGGNGNAGTPAALGGDAGSTNPSGGGGAANAGNAGASLGGTGIGGSLAAGAGSAGQAGGALTFPCGDLNQDLVDDCQQTLVLNSRFDAAVDDWDFEPSTSRVWDTSNASGKAGSGSLRVSNLLPAEQAVGFGAAGSRQCVTVTPMTNYDFAANVMITAGQAAGQAAVNVYLYDDEACAGNFVIGATPISGGEAGKWTALKSKFWVPGGVHSMYVRLVAIKPFTEASLSVLVDDVLVAKRQ